MAKKNIFKEASKIRKANPKMKWPDAVKAAGKAAKVSGVKKTKRKPAAKKVSGVRTVTRKPAKRTVVSGVKPLTRLQKGTAIVGKINGLEKKYSKERNKDLKTLLALDINALHDQLDNLKRAYKKL
jgi:hypothetical protein